MCFKFQIVEQYMNYNTKSYHVVLLSFSNWILSDLSRCTFLNVYYTLIKTLLKIIAAIIQNLAASFGCYRFINNTHYLSWTLTYLHSRNVLLWVDDAQLYVCISGVITLLPAWARAYDAHLGHPTPQFHAFCLLRLESIPSFSPTAFILSVTSCLSLDSDSSYVICLYSYYILYAV